MTNRLLAQYFRDRSFYQLQAGQLVDNPDQRIAADVRHAEACLGRLIEVALRVRVLGAGMHALCEVRGCHPIRIRMFVFGLHRGPLGTSSPAFDAISLPSQIDAPLPRACIHLQGFHGHVLGAVFDPAQLSD
jgi:hypothetical protein